MTTIEIDNPIIEKKYSSNELKMQFISFLENEIKDDKLELFEISIDDLSDKTKNRLKNIDSLNFVEY